MTSIDSLAAGSVLPGRRRASSHALGWRSVLARVYDEPPVADAFTTPPVPELLLVVQLSGVAVWRAGTAIGGGERSTDPGRWG